MCWPVSFAAAFFLALFIYDIVYQDWTDLPYHAGAGVGIVALLWIVCILAGEMVSAGVLVIPLIFVSVFLFTVWFTGKGFERKGCCLNCTGASAADEEDVGPKKLIFVKKEKPIKEIGIPTEIPTSSGNTQCVDTNLNAKPIVQ